MIETGTAPTAGTTVRLYMACCHDNTNFPGGAGTGDASFTAANEPQLGMEPVITLVMPNTANTPIKSGAVLWRPTGRYVAPVVVNGMNQTVRDEATATNNDSRVVLVPVAQTVVD